MFPSLSGREGRFSVQSQVETEDALITLKKRSKMFSSLTGREARCSLHSQEEKEYVFITLR